MDEPIYRRLPCFLIATVDKFASLPWVGEAGALLGKADRANDAGFYGASTAGKGKALDKPLLPPDLIIQDELHLISGPLGTIAGLYEAAIDTLSTREEEGHVVRPKVIASTATVRRAEAQIRALFGRSAVAIFPPPGPDRRDSFFAVTVDKETKAPRLYVGVTAQGRSLKVLLLRSYVALLSATARMYEEEGGAARGLANPADPYMTLLGYFNALRELGGSRRIVEDEVRARVATYGTKRRRLGGGAGHFVDRDIRHEVAGRTSRESTARVGRTKERLALPFSDPEHVDVALATNMISVGLDISRLGLMVVLGQPKAAAEYIQATSRVGRDDGRPGLVVTLLNLHRPRDRSHFERFEAFHASFYRAVEATSVTPFAPRALDRALAAVAVTLARHGLPRLTPSHTAGYMTEERPAASFVAEELSAWGARHNPGLPEAEIERLRTKVKSVVADILDTWAKIARDRTATGQLGYARRERPGDKGVPPLLWDMLDPELANQPREARKFRAARSMRDVEPNVGLWVRRLDGADVKDEKAEG